MKYIGIDFGTKKIGIALSSDTGTMAFPYTVVQNTAHTEEEILTIIANEKVGAIVVGESTNFQGEENKVAHEARAFAETLSKKAALPVYFETELFTTQQARRYPDGSRMKGSPNVDASAAALILTAFLERSGLSSPRAEDDHSQPEPFQKKEGSRYTDHHDID